MINVNEWNRYHVSHILFMFAAENNPFIMNPFPTVKINNMTLDQSYLFKSSKVYNLMTPEKNKAKVDEASRLARLGELVTKRDINLFNEYSGSSSESTAITTDNQICNTSSPLCEDENYFFYWLILKVANILTNLSFFIYTVSLIIVFITIATSFKCNI